MTRARPTAPPDEARPEAAAGRAAPLPDYYTSQYCEENVWHLCQDPSVAAEDAHIVFVSNAGRACPLWMQRASPSEREPVIWDYHVVLLGRLDGWQIWDLDSRLPCPVEALDYLRATFRPERRVPARFRPRFRLVPRAIFLDIFATDRSHMRQSDGGWLAPPPPRPPIGTGAETMNLFRFVDTQSPFVGRVLDLAQLREWLSSGALTRAGRGSAGTSIHFNSSPRCFSQTPSTPLRTLSGFRKPRSTSGETGAMAELQPA